MQCADADRGHAGYDEPDAESEQDEDAHERAGRSGELEKFAEVPPDRAGDTLSRRNCGLAEVAHEARGQPPL